MPFIKVQSAEHVAADIVHIELLRLNVKQTKYFIKGKYIVAEISKKNIAD
jgi:hypothetical protein